MKLKLGILCVQRPQKVLIPLDVEIRMQSALHQHTGAAEFNSLVDPSANFLDRMNVGVGFSRPPVERAESADDVADVGIIDVAIDYICNNIARIFPLSYLVSGKADANKVIGF